MLEFEQGHQGLIFAAGFVRGLDAGQSILCGITLLLVLAELTPLTFKSPVFGGWAPEKFTFSKLSWAVAVKSHRTFW